MGLLSKIKKSKAQSILEYSMLVVISTAAVSGMVIYMRRAMNVRFRHLRQELNESQR